MYSYNQYLQLQLEKGNPDECAFALGEMKRKKELANTIGAIVVVFVAALLIVLLTAWALQASVAQEANMPASGNHPGSVFGAVMIALMWAITANFCGVLIGFLFGIPKTRQLDAKDEADARQQPNTNLEQISDWLTKMIVGIGLIQLTKFPEYLDKASKYLAQCGIPGAPFGAAIILFFLIFGFLSGYLITRLFLASAFGRADLDGSALRLAAGIKIGPGGTKSTVGGGESTLYPAARNTHAMGAMAKTARSSAAASSATTSDPDFLRKWAQAKGRVLEGQFDAAVAEYAELVREFHNDIVIRLEYAWSIFKRDETWSNLLQEQLDRAKELPAAPGSDTRRELYESLCFYPLYRPKGYDEAIVAGEEYLREPKNQLSASIYADLACAYGQKYSDKQQEHAPVDELSAIRAKALDCVRAAVRLDSVMAKTLQWQMVGPNREENDLRVFADQDDFRRAVFLPALDPRNPQV